MLAHIKILASDEFEGREPGTIGENKTINYLATQWQQAGLKPAARDGSWYDPVTLVERRPEAQDHRNRLIDGRSRQKDKGEAGSGQTARCDAK